MTRVLEPQLESTADVGARLLELGLGHSVVADTRELDEDRSGSMWSLGFGYRWNTRGSFIEVQYTKNSADLWAVGFEVAFGYSRR